ncbi:MAG: pyruvate, phosphate dikinase [Nitrososphaerota archaeon]|nr:pyruvate, phosphate dikinase [Nitrososphaerales archaeon]MDW8045425.1 pyruvate, phosphate dikinase [Nitrososphaerota archaeon]
MAKDIYLFEEGDGKNKKLLGGKGAGLCQMTQLGLPVPPGFIITTEVCKKYYEAGMRLPDGLMDKVREAMAHVERKTGKKFGDPHNPLLVSVRSGAAVSMPGMMDTILNLGLNDSTVQGLIEQTGDARFAYDAYRRFIQLFGKIVLGVDEKLFTEVFEEAKRKAGVKNDYELDAESLKAVVQKFKEICEKETGAPFPEDPYVQLEKAIASVFKSWMGKRAVDYRREFKITPDIADGTAVNIVAMVFGNLGFNSATGVVFTRDPATGAKGLYGDYLVNAQGEDVVAGIRTPKPIDELKKEMPESYRELVEICDRLERFYKEPQDVEFTIERGKLYMLQTRDAKMNALALVRTSVDMCKEGILTKEEALLRIKPDQLEQLLHKTVDPKANVKPIAKGVNASPGAACGKVVFDADEAERLGRSGERVILVREETKPEDIHGFFAAQGILTSRGGKTSHAAVVARSMGKPCVVGAGEVLIDLEKRLFTVGDIVVKEGDLITIDGTTGNVYLGEVPMIEPQLSVHLKELLSWANEFRRLGVRANADTPEAARLARSFGAEGIGLCRTERMFNAPDRLPIVVSMILAESKEERMDALNKLMPMQKNDFKEILRAMEGYPVTIRLLDPPLHEFLPRFEELVEEVYRLKYSKGSEAELLEKQKILSRVRVMTEVNPMLGHRGVRVGITHPEIYEMQVRAICEAAAELMIEGVNVKPQIMIPQVAAAEELVVVKEIVDRVKEEVEKKYGLKIPIKFGTMMEVVRACLTADRIAEVTDFFSFGTNDLTQGTFSFSREDAENKFLPIYNSKGILKYNPFQTLDEEGVGKLIKMAVELGKAANPEIEIGICGEHGGDPDSITFCHKANLTYVSASPYRIPIAILAAAQAAIKDKARKA